MSPQAENRYRVERDLWGPNRVDVALVREPAGRGPAGSRRGNPRRAPLVLFSRTFRPRLELAALEHYAAELELVAKHANNGTFGCFVDTRSSDGLVVVRLYERWFDGGAVRLDELASRTFDPNHEDALVESAEFVAELEDWAERRNAEREAAYLETLTDEASSERTAQDRRQAAEDLVRILVDRGGSGL